MLQRRDGQQDAAVLKADIQDIEGALGVGADRDGGEDDPGFVGAGGARGNRQGLAVFHPPWRHSAMTFCQAVSAALASLCDCGRAVSALISKLSLIRE